MRLLIVDDHEIVREGLRAALDAGPGVQIVGEAGTGAEALQLLRRTLPDMSGDVLCRRTLADFPGTRVVILTTYLSEEIVRQATDAGAHGFVTKASGLAELRSVLAGVGEARSMLADPCSDAVVKRLHGAAPDQPGALTPRQERILELLVEGLTYAEIGERLFITESTVRFHIQRLKQKLGAANKAELIAVAIRSALIAPAQDAIGT